MTSDKDEVKALLALLQRDHESPVETLRRLLNERDFHRRMLLAAIRDHPNRTLVVTDRAVASIGLKDTVVAARGNYVTVLVVQKEDEWSEGR